MLKTCGAKLAGCFFCMRLHGCIAAIVCSWVATSTAQMIHNGSFEVEPSGTTVELER